MESSLFATTEFQMSVLLFAALAGYLIAYRINQSAVVGIILAGIVIGPSMLNVIGYTDFVSGLAHLGAVVLLFTIGLEFEMKQITKPGYFLIALAGIIVPWFGGFFIADAFGYDFAASVFVGTALTATSIAITANVLREMGKLQTEAAKAIIGAAVIDDILALLALSVAEGMVGGSLSAGAILLISAKAVGFITVGGVVGLTVLTRVTVRLAETKIATKYPESIFIFAMMVAFLYAMGAEVAGLSAIVGAFLAGVSFAGAKLEHGHRGRIFHEGAEYLQIIFASIFFISLGIILDLRVITPTVIVFIVVLSAVGLVTKLVGCGLPAKLQGMSMRDSLIIGTGMAPRGEVAMIVALIGLNQGLIGQETYAALIMVALLTTVIPPIVLRNWLFRKPASKPH